MKLNRTQIQNKYSEQKSMFKIQPFFREFTTDIFVVSRGALIFFALAAILSVISKFWLQ